MEWAKVRKEALARDDYHCRRCLKPATDVHHRKLKGMGGTSNRDVAFGLPNLVSLCRECHTYIHAHPQYGYESGFLVHSWDDPAEIPIGRHHEDWLF